MKQKKDINTNVCGLCGKKTNLTKTKCCNNWICNDIELPKSKSCHRKHMSYTVCAAHYREGHSGDWKSCKKCAELWEKEDYVWYATNEYNFEKLENPPEYEPTRCSGCNKILDLINEVVIRGANKKKYCLKCEMKKESKPKPEKPQIKNDKIIEVDFKKLMAEKKSKQK